MLKLLRITNGWMSTVTSQRSAIRHTPSEQLGDVVFAEMPKLVATHAKNAEVATVE